MIDPTEVASAHDLMAEEYDQLDDLWYSYLFTRIHRFVAAQLPAHPPHGRLRALDAGCGTGFQSFLLARAGFEVEGFDVAAGLLEVARQKSSTQAVPPLEAPPLFRSSREYSWIADGHASIASRLEQLREGREVLAPRFFPADLATFAPDPGAYDVVTCCGSVLSFLDGYPDALARLAGALKPGGTLLLEVEQKRNLDQLWPIVDALLGGRLEYEQPLSVSLRNLLAPGRSVRIDYPFDLHDGRSVNMPLWLFSIHELNGIFRRIGLQAVAREGVHHTTNLLPSTVLHEVPPHRWATGAFRLLARLDEALGQTWPFWRLGCSTLLALRRTTR